MTHFSFPAFCHNPVKNAQSEPPKTDFFEPLKKNVSDYAAKGGCINIAMLTLIWRGWYTMAVPFTKLGGEIDVLKDMQRMGWSVPQLEN